MHLIWRAHLALLPPSCWRCGTLLPRAAASADGASGHAGYPHLCAPCHAGLPWQAAVADDAPAIAGVDALHAACRYEPPLPEWIQQLKYSRRDGLVRVLGTLLAGQGVSDAARAAHLAVPVPLHPWRLWQRGFNQSLLLAHRWRRELARADTDGSAPALRTDVLVRHRYTRPQVRMRAQERRANVADAFSLHRRLHGAARPLDGQSVLLVDDVVTTGATLSACAAVLRAAGAARVEALVLARAGLEGSTPDRPPTSSDAA